jgi:hypothetical protein
MLADPFIHVILTELPPDEIHIISLPGEATSVWTPIRSPDEAEGTRHFLVTGTRGFW